MKEKHIRRKAEYIRKSRAEENQSTEEVLKKHREALSALSDKLEIPKADIDIYEEIVSGESLYARPQMLKLLEAVQNGEYDAVLCMDIDRLGRGGMADQGIILDAFRSSDTLIITPDKTYDLSDESDEELTEFKAFMARREYKIIRKRMRRGLMQTIQDGGYVANAPYGYQNCRDGKMPTLRIVEDEARFVRMIYDMYESGSGAGAIADVLNSMGSVPKRNHEWGRNTVRQLLRNPTYAGKVAWNRVKHIRPTRPGEKHSVKYMPESEWILVDGKHPAIISPEQWNRVQEMRANKFIPSKKNGGHLANPFAGLVKCGNCGRNIQMMGNNKGVAYMLCNTRGCCAGAKFSLFEASALNALQDKLNELEIEIQKNQKTDTSTLEEILHDVERDIGKVAARKTKIMELLEDGTYTREIYKQRITAAEAEEVRLSNVKAEIERKICKAKSEDKIRTYEALKNALLMYRSSDNDARNQMLKSVVDHMDYFKEKKSKMNDFDVIVHLKFF